MKEYVASDLNNIFLKRHYKTERISSYDRSGGNDDWILLQPGEEVCFADIDGPAVVTHFWCTYGNKPLGDTSGVIGHEPFNLRKIVLKIYWDDETDPSVEVPLGDFFGNVDGYSKQFRSEPIQAACQDGMAGSCWFPMPFRQKARFLLKNECSNLLVFYFYVDYEKVDSLPAESLYFHANWRRELLTEGKSEDGYASHSEWEFGSPTDKNTDGKNNYVILDTVGSGHFAGCLLNIVNCNKTSEWDWYGEGDDMIFIDGESWPPRLHGTGMEDYFSTAWSPTQSFEGLWNGANVSKADDNYKGNVSYYRFHIKDPVIFDSSIRVTIEHGHNNNRSDSYTSVAYWYQNEPHRPQEPLPEVKDRLPLDENALKWGRGIRPIELSGNIE